MIRIGVVIPSLFLVRPSEVKSFQSFPVLLRVLTAPNPRSAYFNVNAVQPDKGVDDIDKLLNQNVYKQEILNLNKYPLDKEINGIKVVDSVALLDDKTKLDLVKKNILQ